MPLQRFENFEHGEAWMPTALCVHNFDKIYKGLASSMCIRLIYTCIYIYMFEYRCMGLHPRLPLQFHLCQYAICRPGRFCRTRDFVGCFTAA